MRIELETVPPRYRSDHPIVCFLCERRFVVGAAMARAYSDDFTIDCGELCPSCLGSGAEGITARLEDNARCTRAEAKQQEKLAAEGVELAVPSLVELRMLAALGALE
jgi:hypothetical protein